MRVRLALFVFVVLLCAVPPAAALKQPLGPEFNISNPATASPGAVSVAADSQTGRYFVVWPGGDLKPRGRLIGRDGTPLTDELVVSDEAGGYPAPVVTYNAGLHEYLVVWSRIGYTPPGGFFAQRVSASGAKIGGVSTVGLGAEQHQLSVACSSRSGACLVAGAGFGVQARLIGPGGGPTGPEVMLAFSGGQIARATQSTAVAYAPEADRFLVAWSWIYGMSGRMFDAGGSPIGTREFRIATAGHYGQRIAYNPHERAFAVLFSLPPSHVAAARVDENGNVAPARVLAGGYLSTTSFAFDSHDRSYLAGWRSENDGAGGGSFLAADLTPIAPADFAGGYVVTYNAAADEYLLVRPSCSQPGNLVAVCGRRVGNPPSAADRTGPALRLTVRRLQRVVRQRGLVLRARCDEPCNVRASARIALPGASRSVGLRRLTRSLGRNVETKLRLKASKRTLRTLRRAFKRRHGLGMRLTVTATDSSGNRTIAKRKLRARS